MLNGEVKGPNRTKGEMKHVFGVVVNEEGCYEVEEVVEVGSLVEERSDEIEEYKVAEMESGEGGSVEIGKDLEQQLGRESRKGSAAKLESGLASHADEVRCDGKPVIGARASDG